MATYKRFEDLPAWQAAARLYEGMEDLLANASPRLRPSFRDQLERATLSVSNNIAEGFERGTTKELLAFLYIARGSAGEVRSMLTLLSRRPWMEPNRFQIGDLMSLSESCSRQLRAWADALQNSEIKGPRHLNDKSRAQYQGRQARNELESEIDAMLPPDHPARRRKE